MERELFPDEFQSLVKRVEEEISWLERDFDYGRLNRCYQWAMSLWDINPQISKEYVKVLNSINYSHLSTRLGVTLHHKILDR